MVPTCILFIIRLNISDMVNLRKQECVPPLYAWCKSGRFLSEQTFNLTCIYVNEANVRRFKPQPRILRHTAMKPAWTKSSWHSHAKQWMTSHGLMSTKDSLCVTRRFVLRSPLRRFCYISIANQSQTEEVSATPRGIQIFFLYEYDNRVNCCIVH